jgi:hypothetical protein
MSLVRPVLNVLDDKQIAQIHEYSLQVLSSVGVRADSASTLSSYCRMRALPMIMPISWPWVRRISNMRFLNLHSQVSRWWGQRKAPGTRSMSTAVG